LSRNLTDRIDTLIIRDDEEDIWASMRFPECVSFPWIRQLSSFVAAFQVLGSGED
jgi:hypothetical protein